MCSQFSLNCYYSFLYLRWRLFVYFKFCSLVHPISPLVLLSSYCPLCVFTNSQYLEPLHEAKNILLCFKPAKNFFEVATSKACKAFSFRKWQSIASCMVSAAIQLGNLQNSKVTFLFEGLNHVCCTTHIVISFTNSTLKSSLMMEEMLLHLGPSPRSQD